MAEQSLLKFTDELLESTCFFCAVCKDILKPPIMLVGAEGNVCGICYEEKQEIMYWDGKNNLALENVLTSLKLPCKYKPKGCSLRPSYKDLTIHQDNCKYRIVVCPMVNIDCDWEGSTVDFIDHFKECHGDHVINSDNNLFVLEMSLSDTKMVKLLVIKKYMFILKMQTNIESSKLYYILFRVDDDVSLCCEYSVKHKGEDENYIKTKSKVVSSYDIYNEFNENIAVKMDLDALKQIFHISNTIKNIFRIKLETSSTETIGDNMLPFFECPVCKHLMKPPIFQCRSGHSLCNFCKPKLQNCPTCRSAFIDTRNSSLEHLTECVQYPCIYSDSGCSEIGLINYIVTHELDCSFKPYKCPFSSCRSDGDHDFIVQHLIGHHNDSVISDGSTSYTLSFNLDEHDDDYLIDDIFETKFIIICNYIFRITGRRVSEETFVLVDIVGKRNVSRTFIYEVSIADMVKPDNKWMRTSYCLNESPEDNNLENSIVFYNNHMSPYSDDDMVKLNVSIKEK